MAEKRIVTTQLVDDLSGEDLPDGTQPTRFKFEGKSFSLDLGAASKKKLDAALAELDKASSAVKVFANAGRTGKEAKPGTSRSDLQKVRDWAKENGHEVSDRGRIKSTVIEAYDAVH